MHLVKRLRRLITFVPALLAFAASGAHAGTSLNVNLSIGDAPPPPVIVVKEAPPTVIVPGTTVYVVEDRRYDYDFFRCGEWWFVYRSGYWYRAKSHRGPFKVCEERVVPAAIFAVPRHRWKHHPHGMPPGQAKKMAHAGNGNAKGKGRGKH
jgi:hypothetical protein